ncbi:MAG: hypothetical protein AB7P14_12695 [Blastocatellales bacterium]
MTSNADICIRKATDIARLIGHQARTFNLRLKNISDSSENPGTFISGERDRARVCSLCEVISHAREREGHLAFFV